MRSLLVGPGAVQSGQQRVVVAERANVRVAVHWSASVSGVGSGSVAVLVSWMVPLAATMDALADAVTTGAKFWYCRQM